MHGGQEKGKGNQNRKKESEQFKSFKSRRPEPTVVKKQNSPSERDTMDTNMFGKVTRKNGIEYSTINKKRLSGEC